MSNDFAPSGWSIELESGWDDDGWTRVPTNIMRDRSLSWKAKGLVAFLAGHKSGFRVTREFIIGASPDGEASVRSGLKELRDAGYLTYRRGLGGNGAYVLRRFPSSPQSCGKPPVVETTQGGNQGQRETKFKVDQEKKEVDQPASAPRDAPADEGQLPLLEAPAKPPTKREPDPVNVNAKKLADIWHELTGGLANFHATRQVAAQALKAGHACPRVEQAMRSLHDQGRPLSAGTLRVELQAPTRPKVGSGFRPYQDSDYWSTP